MTVDEVVAEILASHFPFSPASEIEIQAVERSLPLVMPLSLKTIWRSFNGALLFPVKSSPYKDKDCKLKVLPLEEFQPASLAITGVALPNDTCYVFCGDPDGNYFGVDLNDSYPDGGKVRDIFHETYDSSTACDVVSNSLLDFFCYGSRIARRLGQNTAVGWHITLSKKSSASVAWSMKTWIGCRFIKADKAT